MLRKRVRGKILFPQIIKVNDGFEAARSEKNWVIGCKRCRALSLGGRKS
jgi:hypothetical protein